MGIKLLPFERIGKQHIIRMAVKSFPAVRICWHAVPSKSDYRVVLGAAIRERRRRVLLSQESLAEKADLHPNYIGRVERGEETISLGALLRVATALDVRLKDLVSEL